MKKIIAIVLILALTLSLVACSQPATEGDKEYKLDYDILSDKLNDIVMESDRGVLNDVFAVTDETYSEYVGGIVSKDLISDYIVLLPNTEWTSHVLFAFATENTEEITLAMEEYFAEFCEARFLSESDVITFEASGYIVFATSSDNEGVKALFETGSDKETIQSALLAFKETYPVFSANMQTTLNDEFFAFEGLIEKTDLEEMYALLSTIIGVNPIMVFKPAADVEGSADRIKEAMTAWQTSQLDTMSWYQPNLVPIIENMTLIEENGYLIYIVNEYPEATKLAIEASWVEITA